MPSEYKLKRPALDPNRITKITKKLLDESQDDRKRALEAYKYFKELVDQNSKDDASKNNMTACLKLAQSSKVNITKLVDLFIKLESNRSAPMSSGEKEKSSGASFHELDE